MVFESAIFWNTRMCVLEAAARESQAATIHGSKVVFCGLSLVSNLNHTPEICLETILEV